MRSYKMFIFSATQKVEAIYLFLIPYSDTKNIDTWITVYRNGLKYRKSIYECL